MFYLSIWIQNWPSQAIYIVIPLDNYIVFLSPFWFPGFSKLSLNIGRGLHSVVMGYAATRMPCLETLHRVGLLPYCQPPQPGELDMGVVNEDMIELLQVTAENLEQWCEVYSKRAVKPL